MIPFIRSLNELRLITNPRSEQDKVYKFIINKKNKKNDEKINSDKKDKKVIKLPDLPLKTRYKWKNSKEAVSKFLDSLDYNNQIQPSYDLTLLERQNSANQKEAA
tara:strand:+ start:1493 stop:1807 length:315 start_codon:yes stop_codon:yes gene_type:complete